MNSIYIRPESIESAISSIRDLSGTKKILMGGHYHSESNSDDFVFVDLQALGIDRILTYESQIEYGSMARLQQILEHPNTPESLRDALRIESGQNVRNSLSLAGLIDNADGRSPSLTALLALDPQLEFQPSQQYFPLELYLSNKKDQNFGLFFTKVVIKTPVALAFKSVARTPMDRPILCASVASWQEERIRVSLGGFGEKPCCIYDQYTSNPTASKILENYSPMGDQWASAEYREEMAVVLIKRCLIEIFNHTQEEK